MSTLISNNEIKLIRSLSQKKYRDSTGYFVVEGEKMVEEALKSGLQVEKVFRRDEIGEAAMSRISFLDSPSPALALIRKPAPADADILPSKGLYIALDSVRDPGNLGTILRLCDWFGVDGIFASRDTVDQYNPKTVQATMGAILRHQVIYCDLDRICDRFAAQGMAVFGTFLQGENIYRCELPENALIVMGSESFGISDSIAAHISNRITIPSFAHGAGAESLNVAIATALTVSEFRSRTTR